MNPGHVALNGVFFFFWQWTSCNPPTPTLTPLAPPLLMSTERTCLERKKKKNKPRQTRCGPSNLNVSGLFAQAGVRRVISPGATRCRVSLAEGGRLGAAVGSRGGRVFPAAALRQGPEVTVSAVCRRRRGVRRVEGLKGPCGVRGGGLKVEAGREGHRGVQRASGWVGLVGGCRGPTARVTIWIGLWTFLRKSVWAKVSVEKKREGGGGSLRSLRERACVCFSSCSLSVSVFRSGCFTIVAQHCSDSGMSDILENIRTGNHMPPGSGRSVASFAAFYAVGGAGRGVQEKKKKLVGPPLGLTLAPLRLFAQVGGQRLAAMLSLDEPLDLKLHRRPNGRDRGARSPPLSPLHAKRARQLFMADDGTAVIEPASPASPHTGVYPYTSTSVFWGFFSRGRVNFDVEFGRHG